MKVLTPELLARRACTWLLQGAPEHAAYCACRLIERLPDSGEAWLLLRGALEAAGQQVDAATLRAAAPVEAEVPQSILDRAMSRQLGGRGLVFDPLDGFPIRTLAEVFEEVTTTEALHSGRNVMQVLDPGGQLVEAAPVLELDGAGDPAVAVRYRTAPKFVASMENAVLVGAGVTLTERGEFVRECLPPVTLDKFGAEQVGDQVVFDPAYFQHGKLRLKVFDEPAFLMAGKTDKSFGDWIVNFAPRLALYEAAGLDCPIVVRGPPPEQVLPLLEALGAPPDRLVFHTLDQVSLFPKLFIPSLPTPDKAAPMAGVFDIYRRARAPADPARPMLYLTRRGVGQRPLLNEDEVCELFADRGFRIVNPGELSFDEVRRIFASPACVAGPFGSAFHNLVFSRGHPTSLLLMPPHLPYHLTEIALWQADLGNRFAYVWGDMPPGPHNIRTPWTVAIDKVERALDRMLELVRSGASTAGIPA